MKNNEKTIVDHLLTYANVTPDKKAFIVLGNEAHDEKAITYRRLAATVEKVAAALAEKQWAGKRVLLVYQDVLEFVVSFLACQYAGIIPLPVPYVKGSKQFARLVHIIEDAQASAVLCTDTSIPYLQQGLGQILDKIQIISTDKSVPLKGLQAPVWNEISFIQYTSGSTGHPKGVIITAANLLHNQQLIQNAFDGNSSSVIFSWLPFYHDMGLIGNILHTVYVGCTCVLMSPFQFMQTPKRWLEAITKYKVTHSGAPNFAYDLCVNRISKDELSALDLSGWQVAYNGSEPVRPDTLQRFSEYFAPAGFKADAFYPCYGLAEATLLVSGNKQQTLPVTLYIDHNAAGNGFIQLVNAGHTNARAVAGSGKVADGMQLKIISLNDGAECGELQEGEICIAGESVTTGYWNKPGHDLFYELDGTKFLRTGDLGFLYNGELFVHGRLKEMLIIRGKNVYPYDIEQLASGSHAAIEPNGVAVFSTAAQPDALVIVAEVKRTAIRGLDAAAVIRIIDQAVAGAYGITPYDIVLTTPLGIPRTTSGKLQRVKCRDSYQQQHFEIIAAKLAIGNSLLQGQRDERLLAIVKEEGNYANIKAYVLDLLEAKTGSTMAQHTEDGAELTEMGVDSLRAMEIINAINKELHIRIDATKLYQYNTLFDLICTVENMLWLKTEQTSGKEITI